jgi:hypothetical protein
MKKAHPLLFAIAKPQRKMWNLDEEMIVLRCKIQYNIKIIQYKDNTSYKSPLMAGVLPQYKYINKIISSDTPNGSQSEQDNTPLRVGVEPQYKSPFRAGGIPQYKHFLLFFLLLF